MGKEKAESTLYKNVVHLHKVVWALLIIILALLILIIVGASSTLDRNHKVEPMFNDASQTEIPSIIPSTPTPTPVANTTVSLSQAEIDKMRNSLEGFVNGEYSYYADYLAYGEGVEEKIRFSYNKDTNITNIQIIDLNLIGIGLDRDKYLWNEYKIENGKVFSKVEGKYIAGEPNYPHQEDTPLFDFLRLNNYVQLKDYKKDIDKGFKPNTLIDESGFIVKNNVIFGLGSGSDLFNPYLRYPGEGYVLIGITTGNAECSRRILEDLLKQDSFDPYACVNISDMGDFRTFITTSNVHISKDYKLLKRVRFWSESIDTVDYTVYYPKENI